jgi:uncharacterized membrane protein
VYHSIVVLLRRAFRVAAVSWAIALPLAAWVASRPHASSAVSAMTIAIYGVGSIVCHQLPERSFHLWSAQLPVCARCTGIYLGAALAAIRSAGASRSRSGAVGREALAGRLPSGVHGARTIVIVALIPSLATLVYEWTTGEVPSNWIRFAAGLPLGVVVSWLVHAPAAMPSR